jgi:hypothetical protein
MAASLAYPSEEKGVFYLFKIFLPAVAVIKGREGRGQYPVTVILEEHLNYEYVAQWVFQLM